MRCSICNESMERALVRSPKAWAEGHNAQPINNGRCCSTCNMIVVIPARIKEMQNIKQQTKEGE